MATRYLAAGSDYTGATVRRAMRHCSCGGRRRWNFGPSRETPLAEDDPHDVIDWQLLDSDRADGALLGMATTETMVTVMLSELCVVIALMIVS